MVISPSVPIDCTMPGSVGTFISTGAKLGGSEPLFWQSSKDQLVDGVPAGTV